MGRREGVLSPLTLRILVKNFIWLQYSGNSINANSRKRTALLTAAFTKPCFSQLHTNCVFLHSRKRTILVDGRGHFKLLRVRV